VYTLSFAAKVRLGKFTALPQTSQLDFDRERINREEKKNWIDANGWEGTKQEKRDEKGKDSEEYLQDPKCATAIAAPVIVAYSNKSRRFIKG